MAYSLSSLSRFNQALCWHKIMFHYPKMIRSQSFRDNGKPENSVDANISVLRERIRSLRRRERLMDRSDGWNYKNYAYEKKYKRSSNHHHHNQGFISEFAELIAITFGSMGLVFLFGSLLIFLASFLVFISKN